MITSSNGNIFRVTGHLCGEFNSQRWIPYTKASDAELWYLFDLRPNKRLRKQSWGWWFETPSRQLWRQCNGGLFPHKNRFSVIKISTSWGRLIIVMVIPMMERWYFYIETTIALLSVLGIRWFLYCTLQQYRGIIRELNFIQIQMQVHICSSFKQFSRKYVFVVISWPGAVETLDIPPKFILKLKSREISYFSDAQILRFQNSKRLDVLDKRDFTRCEFKMGLGGITRWRTLMRSCQVCY